MSAPRAVVCYDEARPGMYLRIEEQDIASFMASAAWRAWLYYPASAVDGTDRDRILLDGGMGLRECQDMLEAIMEADGHGVEVAVDPSFGAFVNAGETYIRERSEVGLAIKAQTAEGIADDPQLGPRFREFRDVVNASMVRPLRDRQMLDAFFMATVGRGRLLGARRRQDRDGARRVRLPSPFGARAPHRGGLPQERLRVVGEGVGRHLRG